MASFGVLRCDRFERVLFVERISTQRRRDPIHTEDPRRVFVEVPGHDVPDRCVEGEGDALYPPRGDHPLSIDIVEEHLTLAGEAALEHCKQGIIDRAERLPCAFGGGGADQDALLQSS